MSTKIQVVILILCAMMACSKKETEVKPEPQVDILFERETGVHVIANTPFERQDTITLVQIKELNQLIVNILENNLNEDYGFTIEDAIMGLIITTGQDEEYFLTRDNCRMRSAYKGNSKELWTIGGQIIFPVKITDDIVKNNDTLELASSSLTELKVFYQSKYSGLTAADSLVISKK